MSNDFVITLSRSWFNSLNDMIKERSGKDILSLAHEDPRHAYRLLMAFGEAVASATSETKEVKRAGKCVATSKMDGAAATTGLASHMMKESQPDIDIEPVDVAICVYRNPNLKEIFTGKLDPTDTVVAFRVEPPSLAN